jgi:hypothetical protein
LSAGSAKRAEPAEGWNSVTAIKYGLADALIYVSHNRCYLAAVNASEQERTGCCDVPDIIGPVIDAGVPVMSAVKFDDPSFRTAVTATRALPPMRPPENITES